jgi:uncharacterized cupredoxin-like copper-binding protein
MAIRARGEPAAEATGSELARRGTRLAIAALAVAGLSLVGWAAAGFAPRTVEIEIRWSSFTPAEIHVPEDVPITFVLANGDPIDHEWIIGEDAVHARHRTGIEPAHATRPTEVSLAAGASVTTTITFPEPGRQAFICHLPGHEAYGMVGTLVIGGG